MDRAGWGWAGRGLTSLLHEAEEVVQELLPPGVTVQLIQLCNKRRTLHTPHQAAPCLPKSTPRDPPPILQAADGVCGHSVQQSEGSCAQRH